MPTSISNWIIFWYRTTTDILRQIEILNTLPINNKTFFFFFLSEQIRAFSKLDPDWLTNPLLHAHFYTID